MIHAKISNITADGSFQGPKGMLYAFRYSFEGGPQGLAFHQKAQSPYNIGDDVTYEEAGQTKRGDTKIKFVREGGFTAQFKPGTTPPKVGFQPKGSSSGPNLGMRTGMSINAAVAWLKDKPVDLSTEQGRVLFAKHAKYFFHLAEKMESGDTEPAKATEPKPEPKAIPQEDEDPPF